MRLILELLSSPKIIYCPQCSNKLEEKSYHNGVRLVCRKSECGYVHYDNPTPVVAVIVEMADGVVLAHNRQWPFAFWCQIAATILES